MSNFCTCAILILASVLLLDPLQASASSGTMVITTDTTLSEDHQGNILVNANNVTLDCASHTISGPGVSGFHGGIEVAGGLSGVTVRRCKVTGFGVNGVFGGGGATGGRYEDNVLFGNGDHGMHLDVGSGYVVLGNDSHSNGGIGIVLTGASQSWIVQNTVEDNQNWAGIALLDGSHDNFLVNNTAQRNGIGFVLDSAINNELRFNTASSNGQHGFVLLRSANGNLVQSNTANRNNIGFGCSEGANSNELRDNHADLNVSDGFNAYQSNGNSFTKNSANKNGNYGFLIFGGSSFNALTGNAGQRNGLFDGYDEGTGTGNVWKKNRFGKTAGF